jgi:hypothetical protein
MFILGNEIHLWNHRGSPDDFRFQDLAPISLSLRFGRPALPVRMACVLERQGLEW